MNEDEHACPLPGSARAIALLSDALIELDRHGHRVAATHVVHALELLGWAGGATSRD